MSQCERGSLNPGPGVLAAVQELGLRRPRSGLCVVHPASGDGEGHEDGLNTATSLKAKGGPPVIHEVELDIASTAPLKETAWHYGNVILV